MTRLDGRIALVTGASSGIGRGVALAFAAAGADLAINYPVRGERARAEAVAREVEAHGRRALLVQADVSLDQPVKRMIARVVRHFGRLDILVNNAGIGVSPKGNAARVEDMAPALWDRMIAVDLRSVYLCTHYALPHMYRQDYGRIISTASQLARLGRATGSHYAAAKGGIIAFTRALAREIGARNITANCVAPGATETPLLAEMKPDVRAALVASIPKRRLAEIAEIVPAFVYLASDEARFVMGQTISPNGGDAFI